MGDSAKPRGFWTTTIVVTALATIAFRLLVGLEMQHISLLYIGIPALVAIALLWLAPSPNNPLLSYLYTSLIVMLASSALLHEGFICVVFFAPIYFAVVLAVYGIDWLYKASRSRREKLSVSVLPIFLFIAALEGVSPATTFSRNLVIHSSIQSTVSVQEAHAHMLNPPAIAPSRNWMLSIFPMPYQIDISGSQPGDTHEVHYEYRRWLVTNIKRGSMLLHIDAVTPNRIDISFHHDDSYLSAYVALKRSRIDMTALPGGGSRVDLTIHLDRRLDPAWYFGPIQRYAVQAMADHILNEFVQARAN